MRRARGVGVGLMIVLLIVTVYFRTGPSQVQPGETTPDAIAMFVGGRGERLERALDFRAASPASALVIPNGDDARWPDANSLCDSGDPQIFCPTPDPDSTRGEAEAIANLATDNGWEHVVIVTSDYHTARAAALLDHCLDARIESGVADSDLSMSARAKRLTHEWFGHIDARFLNRGCG